MDPDQIVKNSKRDNDNDDEDDDEEEEEEEDVLTALVVVINTGTTGQPKLDQARKNPTQKEIQEYSSGNIGIFLYNTNSLRLAVDCIKINREF